MSRSGLKLRAIGAAILCLALPAAGKALPCRDKVQILTTTLPPAVSGEAYLGYLDAQGGDASTRVWSAEGLPPGFTMEGDGDRGTILGAPTELGTWVIKVRVIDVDSCWAESVVGMTVGPWHHLRSRGLPDAFVGLPYRSAVKATGGTAPVRYRLVQGDLPPGIALDSSGVIAGTVPAGTPDETYNFEIEARDAAGHVDQAAFAIRLYELPFPAVNQGGCSSSAGAAAWFGLVALAGLRRTRRAALPLLALAAALAAPSVARASDCAQEFVRGLVPPAILGEPYRAALPFHHAPHWIWTATGLPPGLELVSGSDGGAIAGIASEVGTWLPDFTGEDAAGRCVDYQLTFDVQLPGKITLHGGDLPDAIPGARYGVVIPAEGTMEPAVYTLFAGALPPGLVLGADGVIAGTVDASAPLRAYPVVIGVQDAGNREVYAVFSITTVAPAASRDPPGCAAAGSPAGWAGLLGLLLVRRRR